MQKGDQLINETLYNNYLNSLIRGDREECTKIVLDLLARKIPIKDLYTDLFQKSLYHVGELWEFNRISVAVEHLATAITEGLLGLVYPELFDSRDMITRKKVIISCSANEYHQIGGKMVADLFELNGWDSHFLGANTPVKDMLEHIENIQPEMVGLSLSIYFNINSLKSGVEAIRGNFRNLDIIVGGQAFKFGGVNALKDISNLEYIPSLDELEKEIKQNTC